MKSRRLCEICLLDNHFKNNCKSPYRCSVNGCKRRHSNFLHQDIAPPQVASPSHQLPISPSPVTNTTNGHVRTNDYINDVCLPVVNVKVNGVPTCALLDSGSTNTFCCQDFIDMIGSQKQPTTYGLQTLNQTKLNNAYIVDNLEVTSDDGQQSLVLNGVLTTDTIPTNAPSFCSDNHEHLKDIPYSPPRSQVKLLIGLDNPEALVPLSIKRGNVGDPYAVETLLGWTINGPDLCRTSASAKVISNFICTRSVSSDVNQLWDIESEGLNSEDVEGLSVNDRKVLNLWNTESKFDHGHYVLPIPWKDVKKLFLIIFL